MTTKTRKIVLVDKNDQPIGTEDKLVAHERGLLHRAFSVFVFRNNNGLKELLMQQRESNKYHSENLWSNTCCSHPLPDEDILNAGKRRLKEEMGIEAELKLMGSFIYKVEFDNGLIEHEFDHVLVGRYNNDPVDINRKEVAAYGWQTIPMLEEELLNSPERFTPWFKEALLIARGYNDEQD